MYSISQATVFNSAYFEIVEYLATAWSLENIPPWSLQLIESQTI